MIKLLQVIRRFVGERRFGRLWARLLNAGWVDSVEEGGNAHWNWLPWRSYHVAYRRAWPFFRAQLVRERESAFASGYAYCITKQPLDTWWPLDSQEELDRLVEKIGEYSRHLATELAHDARRRQTWGPSPDIFGQSEGEAECST